MSRTDIIKGFHPLAEALESGKTIKKIFLQANSGNEHVREIINLARKYHVPFQVVPREKLNSMTGGVHQGIVALVSPVEFISVENLIPFLYDKGETPLLAVLDEITDVRNFGAVFRSAEFLGVNGIIIPSKGSADINDETIKASAGAIFKINICREENIIQTLKFLKSSGIRIVSASEKATQLISEADFSIPVAIVLGSEERGVSQDILKISDVIVKIQGTGQINSLNVSVAAGIFFYEAARQRK
jgi:23S rRNA (guanosine2251-2'-O)-methyltransferase